MNIQAGTLKPGAAADIAVVDLDLPWVVDREQLHSRTKNSPFDEARLTGRVIKTIVAGRVVYSYA